MVLFDYDSPIPEAIKDTDKLEDFFKKWYLDGKVIVPYYSDDESTSHSMLYLLHDLCQRSPSYKACEGQIIDYAFGKKLKIIKKAIPGFDDEEEELIDRKEQLEFYQDLKDLGIGLTGIRQRTIELQKHKFQSGNAWLRIRIAFEGETAVVKFKTIHYRKIAKLNTRPGETPMAIIVKEWDDVYWKKHKTPPVIVPVTELEEGATWNWAERKNGEVLDTVVHIKTEGNDESDIYGRTDLIAIIEWMLGEIGYGELTAKGNNKDLLTKLLMFFKEEPPENDEGGAADEEKEFKKKLNSVRKVITTEGNYEEAKNLAGMTYHDEAPTVVKMDVKRDSAWYKQSSVDITSRIYAVMKWYKELTGNSQATSGIGTNTLINLFMIANEGTIQPLQVDWEENWGIILEGVFERVGKEGAKNYNIQFGDKISDLVEKMKAANQAKITQVNQEGVDDEANMKAARMAFDNMAAKANAYGVGVRAGLLTPQRKDEEAMRIQMELPFMSEEVEKAWEDDKGVRRPITLKSEAVQTLEEVNAAKAKDENDGDGTDPD